MEEMAQVEWEGGLYHTETEIGSFDFDGPFLPGTMVRASLVAGARMTKGGANVERGVTVPKMGFKLDFDGPRDLQGLREDKRFWDQRMVTVGRAKVPRTRPIFPEWGCIIEIAFDDGAIKEADIIRHLDDAARYHGFGDGRKLGYGRFEATPMASRSTSVSRDNGVGIASHAG
jgi:hypothetical protein